MVVWSATVEILLVTSEFAPYSGRSGLAAFASALPKGLRGLGHHVVVVSPLYSSIDVASHSLARRLSTLEVEVAGDRQKCTLYDGRTTGGIDLLFIGHPVFGECSDAADTPAARQAGMVLSQAAAAVAKLLDPAPDVVHAVGFQAALVLALCKAAGPAPVAVLSPYNLRLQGQCTNEEVATYSAQGPVAMALREEPVGDLLAAAMRAADRVVVDSQASLEALAGDAELADLHAVIGERKGALSRVLSGLDAAYWNPATDSHLASRFDPADTTGKDQCKSALQYELGLPARPDTPLFAAMGGSLATEDLQDLEALLRNDAHVVVGVDGKAPSALAELCSQHEDSLKIMDVSEIDAQHRLISASDFLWVLPSCPPESLFHLQGLRYGALPVVLGQGAAAEMVVDCDQSLLTGNGFLFAAQHDQLSALQRAVSAFTRTDAFEALRVRAMRTDVSWDRAARHFEYIYRGAMEGKAS